MLGIEIFSLPGLPRSGIESRERPRLILSIHRRKNNMTKVFVGIPTKDRPHFLRETVQSVLAQTFTDFRVIVSDNRSRPEVSREIEAFVRSLDDPRVSYFLQPIDEGEYGQGRYFISQCEEPFFAILNDDDLLEPDHLENALRVLESVPSAAFYCNSQNLIDADGALLEQRTREYEHKQGRDQFQEGIMHDVLENLLYYGGLFSISGSVIRTSAVKEYGLVDPNCSGLFPFEFNVFLRLAEQGHRAWYTPRRSVRFRCHDNTQRSADNPPFNRVMMGTLIKLLECRRFYGTAERRRRRLLSFCYRNYAYILYIARDRKACYRYLSRALRLNPLAWNIWAYVGFAILVPFLIRPFWEDKVTLRDPLQPR